MHAHETLIRDFYAAFARHDAEAMARCYHADIFFTDPVFPALRGRDAGDMWRMLLSRAKDLEVTLDEASADETSVDTGSWAATGTATRMDMATGTESLPVTKSVLSSASVC